MTSHMWTSQHRVVTVIAAALAVLGLIMTFAPDAVYTATAFRWTFEWVPRRVWGATFLTTGVVTAVFHDRLAGRVAGAVLTAVCALYGVTLLGAVWSGDSRSGSGWIWPSTTAAVLALSRPHRVKTG